MRVWFHPEAETDHLKQIAYYENEQSGLGGRYQDAVEAALKHICEAPGRFPVECEPGIRRYRIKKFPFTVFFRESGGTLLVFAIAPYRRNPVYWRDRF